MNIAWPENILGDKNWDEFEFFQGVRVSQVWGLRSEFSGSEFSWHLESESRKGRWDSLWDEPHAQDIINAQENTD